MQLLSMEVNQLGNADRTQVGMLGSGLNAVYGQRGSGKSSLLRWLRSMLRPAATPDAYQASHGNWSDRPEDSRSPNSGKQRHGQQVALATGRVTVRIGDAEYQLERQQRNGRPESKVLRRAASNWSAPHVPHSEHPAPYSADYDQHWHNLQSRLGAAPAGELVTPVQREAFDRLSAIASDSQAIFRLWVVARSLQLEEPTGAQPADERALLVQREHDLFAQLQPLEGLHATREGNLARRRQLETELDRVRRQSNGRHYAPKTDDHHLLADRLAALDRDAQAIREQIATLDAAIAKLRDGQTVTAHHQSYRERLLALDAQLARWRNTLTEIGAHRQRLEAAATDAHLDGQLGEQFTPINQAAPRLALRSLESQIVEARRLFDALVDGYQRQCENTDEARHELPQTLRLMQRELHEVCQQLSRQESLTSNRAMKDQILQLARCESEMRLAIDRLIAERGDLLRTIATACQLSVDQVAVAYSDTCRCADHPRLGDWLSAVANGPGASALALGEALVPPRLVDELNALELRRSQAHVQLENVLRDHQETDSRLRRLGVAPTFDGHYDRQQTELLAELDRVNEELVKLETRDRLRVELTDVRRRLQHLPVSAENPQSLRGRYLRHLAGLTGMPADRTGRFALADQLHRDAFVPTQYAYQRGAAEAFNHGFANGHGTGYVSVGAGGDRFEPVRGIYGSVVPGVSVPDAHLARLEEVALRLAIVDALSHRGHPIPLVLDETLDGFEGPRALAATRYLAGHADVARQQILLLTADQELVAAVRSARGHSVPIVTSRAVQQPLVAPDYDVNRQLTAFANDHETEKWHEPEWSLPPIANEPKKRWVLTHRSDVADVPSIGPAQGARLRALGVATVADLLDTEVAWLVDNAELPQVDDHSIRAWQNEARLLCAMRNLRPFDARILAGAGVRDQHQLRDMDPSRLLARVEEFLSTERGKRIMRSGSSYELSRLTAWLASAKRGHGSSQNRDSHEPSAFDALSQTRRSRNSERFDVAHEAPPTYHIVERDDDEDHTSASRRDRQSRSSRPSDSGNGNARESQSRSRSSRNRSARDAEARQASSRHSGSRSSSQPSSNAHRDSNDARLKFYLEPSSSVVDAPSIGESMATALEATGVLTVNDLLSANADQLANTLGQPRVTSAVIRAWQEQSRLVCRIPHLRGHDAQILVACGITSPEALARMEAGALLSQAVSFARSNQGQRVLRGGQEPDLDEVKQWIAWASQSRALMAA